MNDVAGIFQKAIASLQNRDLATAERAFREVLKAAPSHVPALNLLTVVLMSQDRFADAEPYIARAIALNGSSDVSFYNAGLIAKRLHKLTQAADHFGKALALNPNVPETWNNRGTVWKDLKNYDAAISDFDRAIALKEDYAEAYANKGNSLLQLRRFEDAFAAFDRALALRPDLSGVEGARLESKMLVCDWRNLAQEIEHLTASVRSGTVSCAPFTLLYLTGAGEDHLACARTWAAANHPPLANPVWPGAVYNHDRIRVGYLSADFHKHATAYLMAEVFELHDRSRFHISALSLGPDDNSDLRQRLRGSFDEFVDCRRLSDVQLAALVRDSEIDILVDLKGYTEDSRPNVFAQRAAPVQVSYLGYPGTMGAPYMDYIIGDPTVFAASDAALYSEKLVRLPHSYQPNDRKRPIGATAPQRSACGLPDSGFVFCCFNNNYKILPAMFDSWMRILGRVEGSVLWLLECHPSAKANLLREAAARGVDPVRLVFAQRAELPEHLARHRLADLFIDTLPYNAHTTASDALWAGLPVLTQFGEAFAGRVAASLLHAVGLPELVARSREEYETVAVDLAKNPDRLHAIKQKLERNRLTGPLFDAAHFTRDLETAYAAMTQRYRAGLLPDHIDVQAIVTAGG
jgi:predicted O-linked N-acetylglucosamine transferase (SPINDLY family)